MGLAASQARLLQLTSRQHNIEYEAQRIQAMKLQLANESDYAYTTYMNALDAKKIQYRYVDSDGSVSYKNATFANMFTYQPGSTNIQDQYALQIATGEDAGKFYVTATVAKIFDTTNNKEAEIMGKTAEEMKNLLDKAGIDYKGDMNNLQSNLQQYKEIYLASNFAKSMNSSTAEEQKYYENLYLVLRQGNGVVAINDANGMEDSRFENGLWLTNMIESGAVYLHKFNIGVDNITGENSGTYMDIGRTGDWDITTVSNDTLLQEVADDTQVKKAEAKYEAETARINKKDAQYDTLLSQTETERTAIKTEMDSLKQVRNENIEKNFKVFA